MTPMDSTRNARRARRAAVAVVSAAALVLAGGFAVPSAGEDAAPRAAAARTGVVFRLTFDGRGAVRDGTTFKNAAGKGKVRVRLDSGRFKRVRGKPGKALRYPVAGGYGLLEGPDRKAWDPGRRDFRFGVRVKIAKSQATAHMNAFQKGYHRQAGGQWKLQIDQGLPSCVVRGDIDRILVRSAEPVTDGRWHRLVCWRTSEHGVRLFVDGALVADKDAPTGKVANAAPIRIGAKKLGPGSVDQFHGRVDGPYLFVSSVG
ncbi:hypothetical protein GCM10009623_07440 [Nocardioides aestuarii]|uniref:LamG-like jellyroll fold domain-containing protein n=1 Tax=Nocardioides aestuarii TaxID=252231 RepID=A0ABW4TI41_9ACTN